MHRVTFYGSRSTEDSSVCVQTVESFDIPELKRSQILIKVSAAVLVDHTNLLSIEGLDDSYSLANDVVGIVEKVGSDVSCVNVGDTVVGMADPIDGQTGLSSYCILEEGCTVVKPPNVSTEDILCVFSSYLEASYMVYLLPKVPLKHTFLVSGNTNSCLSQFLIKKLISLKCKVIVWAQTAIQRSVLASRFPEAVVLEVVSNEELVNYVNDDTFRIGMSAIFHIDKPLSSSDACVLLKCLSVNGTIVSNCSDKLSDSLNFESDRLKSPVFHLFNFEATVNSGMFSAFFDENSSQLISNPLSSFLILVEKNIINLKAVDDYIKTNELRENYNGKKTIVKF